MTAGDVSAPERIETDCAAVDVLSNDGPQSWPGAAAVAADEIGWIREDVHARVVAERDEARLDSEEIKAIDEVLDDHLVPQLDESQTPVGGALRVELLVRERDMAREDYSAWKAQAVDHGRDLTDQRARADRYREALVNLEVRLALGDGSLAEKLSAARSLIRAALAEGEQPAPRVVHTEDCDGQRLSYHAATGDDMACVCGADDRAEGEQPAGETPDGDVCEGTCVMCGAGRVRWSSEYPEEGCWPAPAAGVQSTPGQRQDSTADQVESVRLLAQRHGCYDAADWIVRMREVDAERHTYPLEVGVQSTTETARKAGPRDEFERTMTPLGASTTETGGLLDRAMAALDPRLRAVIWHPTPGDGAQEYEEHPMREVIAAALHAAGVSPPSTTETATPIPETGSAQHQEIAIAAALCTYEPLVSQAIRDDAAGYAAHVRQHLEKLGWTFASTETATDDEAEALRALRNAIYEGIGDRRDELGFDVPEDVVLNALEERGWTLARVLASTTETATGCESGACEGRFPYRPTEGAWLSLGPGVAASTDDPTSETRIAWRGTYFAPVMTTETATGDCVHVDQYRQLDQIRERAESRSYEARQAVARLLAATEPYMDEAAPGETLFGPWAERFARLAAAREAARSLLPPEHLQAAALATPETQTNEHKEQK